MEPLEVRKSVRLLPVFSQNYLLYNPCKIALEMLTYEI